MRRRRFKKKRRLQPFVIIILFFILIVYSFIFVDKQVRPIIEALSETEVRIIATQGVNNGVSKALKKDVNYDDLINIVKDENGNITLIQANTVEINLLGSDIAKLVQESIEVLENDVKEIPLGNIMGSKMFANYGPKFKAYIISLGSIVVDFYTEFEQAGINQTIHRLYLVIDTKVQIIVPLSSKVVKVTSNIPITETVIVGDVPKSYINVPDFQEKDFLDVTPIPNIDSIPLE